MKEKPRKLTNKEVTERTRASGNSCNECGYHKQHYKCGSLYDYGLGGSGRR